MAQSREAFPSGNRPYSALVAVLEDGPPARAAALPAALSGPLAFVAPDLPDGRAASAE